MSGLHVRDGSLTFLDCRNLADDQRKGGARSRGQGWVLIDKVTGRMSMKAQQPICHHNHVSNQQLAASTLHRSRPPASVMSTNAELEMPILNRDRNVVSAEGFWVRRIHSLQRGLGAWSLRLP